MRSSAEVELVVAEAGGVQAPRVLDVDRRHVLEQRRVRRRRTDVVAGRQQQSPAGEMRGLLVEHRREPEAPPTPTLTVGRQGSVVRVELTVEVVQPDDRDRPVLAAVLEQVAPHDALAVLRRRDVEQERRRRREVDAADVVDHAALDRPAAGQERGAHVRVAVEVLHVRDVAVLAEERRPRDQRAGRRRVELVRRVRERHDVAGAGRVRHVGGLARAVRDVAGLGLGEDAVDHVPALGLPVAGPVVGVLEGEERGLDPGHLGRLVRGRHLLEARRRPGRARRG